jgi:hypothetical protein
VFASIGFPLERHETIIVASSVSIEFVVKENRGEELTELTSLSREIHGQSEPTDMIAL